MGSIFDSNEGTESDINNRVKLAWMKSKQLTGVLCDTKVLVKQHGKVDKTVNNDTELGGQTERRKQITCRGNEDATMDTG